eukprot:scaffold3791_cov390-Prasinococcus_capsulatus_cf.AAC.29
MALFLRGGGFSFPRMFLSLINLYCLREAAIDFGCWYGNPLLRSNPVSMPMFRAGDVSSQEDGANMEEPLGSDAWIGTLSKPCSTRRAT